MKIYTRIILLILGFFLIFFIGLHIFVNIQGKAILTQKLHETFKRDIRIDSLTTSFPLGIHIRDIEAAGLFRIEEVFASGGLTDIFKRNFRLGLLKVVRPLVIIEKGLPAAVSETVIPAPQISQSPASSAGTVEPRQPDINPFSSPRGQFLFPNFSVGRLVISDGTINFTDRDTGSSPITIKAEHLNAEFRNLNFLRPGNAMSTFRLSGDIPWGEGKKKGTVSLDGWINLGKKDMQASVKIEDIDGIYLYPYYSNWVDLEKARIESATLNFNSNIQGLNNDITADCHLELSDIVRKPRPADEPQEKAEKITDVVLDIFRAMNQGKIVLNFTIRTKMDRPEFGFGSIKMAFEDKLNHARKGTFMQDIFAFPGKLFEEATKTATDFSRAVVDGVFAVGSEIKKGIEVAFKKEK